MTAIPKALGALDSTGEPPRPSPVALIVGASRGLGLALASEYLKRGWRVIATMRGESPTSLHALADRSAGRLEIETVDITEPDQVAALRERIDDRRLDLLFVNAGVTSNDAHTVAEATTEDFVRLMVTNALSPMRVVEAFKSLVRPTGAIGVMSSGLGSVSENTHGHWELYSASKAALNMLMRSFAARRVGDPRAMLLIAPGWVRTDMGGPGADLGVEESIPGVVDAIASRAGQPGLRYLDYRGRIVPW